MFEYGRRHLNACVALGLLAACAGAQAEAPDLGLGRYLSKYPGMYASVQVSRDPRDSVFDQSGEKIDGVLPTYGAGNEFAETRGTLALEWHFPWFETAGIPLVSDRLWSARATLGYARLETQGPIEDAVAEQDGVAKGDGLTDIDLAFGPVLYGSRDWRTRKTTPLSLLLLFNLGLPVGERDPDAPNNVGSNVFSYGATLGGHAQVSGWLLDAGLAWRGYARNHEPAFGAQEPAQRGDDFVFDATLARRLLRDLYLSVSWHQRSGGDNQYSELRYSANPPPPSLPIYETFPDPGNFHDGGTRLSQLAVGLHGYLGQRLLLSLDYVMPQSGRSGGFDLPYLEQLSDCAALGGCNPQANGSDPVDGLFSARSYASEYFVLGAQWNFGQGGGWR